MNRSISHLAVLVVLATACLGATAAGPEGAIVTKPSADEGVLEFTNLDGDSDGGDSPQAAAAPTKPLGPVPATSATDDGRSEYAAGKNQPKKKKKKDGDPDEEESDEAARQTSGYANDSNAPVYAPSSVAGTGESGVGAAQGASTALGAGAWTPAVVPSTTAPPVEVPPAANMDAPSSIMTNARAGLPNAEPADNSTAGQDVYRNRVVGQYINSMNNPAIVDNPAVARRYLAIDRATYQSINGIK